MVSLHIFGTLTMTGMSSNGEEVRRRPLGRISRIQVQYLPITSTWRGPSNSLIQRNAVEVKYILQDYLMGE
jgi:hypothetical protein